MPEQTLTISERIGIMETNGWAVKRSRTQQWSIQVGAEIDWTIGRMSYGDVETIPVRNPYGKMHTITLTMDDRGFVKMTVVDDTGEDAV